MKTVEEVTEDVLALPRKDREKVIDRVVDTFFDDSERAEIEKILQDRLSGDFTVIEDPESHFEERLRHHKSVLNSEHG